MGQDFAETSHRKINRKVFGENLVAIYGEKPSPFCDDCGNRHSYCECKKTDISSLTSEIHLIKPTSDGITEESQT